MTTSRYIPFTDQQKEQAAHTDLEAFLRSRGETLLRSGHEKRLDSDHSVTIRGNEWYDHATGEGGNAVSFLQKHYGLSFPDAMTMLLEDSGFVLPVPEKPPDPPKPFQLPAASPTMRRVFAYLIKQRKIDRDIVSHFVREGLIYEGADHHDVIFVGVDKDGIPRHAHRRSTNRFGKSFRATVEGSVSRHSFHHNGNSGSLFIFEAPIDMLSYISMNPEGWEEHSYVACCGTSFLPVEERIADEQIDFAYLCLDNDEAGNAASARMSELLTRKGILSARLAPVLKDWNEDLCAGVTEEQEAEQCPALRSC